MKINVNNISLNYEVKGQGIPIILLHGNGESNKIFDKLIPQLTNKYTVYAIDSRCHGKSDNPKNISYDLMADDIIAFIKKLKLKRPILYGFSDGGITGLLIAIKEKDILSKLIISGANLNSEGFTKKMLIACKLGYFFTRSKLFKMMITEPNISLDELKRISIPTHILVGEKDIIKLKHTQIIKDNLKNSTLEIIKEATHGSYIIHNDDFYSILEKYL